MGIAGFRDPALRPFRAARVLGGHQADERHGARGGGETTGVAEFGGDRERGQVIDAAEAAQALHAGAQGLEVQERTALGFDVPEPGEYFIDRTQVGVMGLIQGGQRPGLGPQPHVVALRPGLLGGSEAPAMAEEELREAVPGAEQISADVLATSQEIPRGLFLLGWNVNGGERARAIPHGEVPGIPSISFDAIARTARDERGGDDVAR